MDCHQVLLPTFTYRHINMDTKPRLLHTTANLNDNTIYVIKGISAQGDRRNVERSLYCFHDLRLSALSIGGLPARADHSQALYVFRSTTLCTAQHYQYEQQTYTCRMSISVDHITAFNIWNDSETLRLNIH